mgnify:FL=1
MANVFGNYDGLINTLSQGEESKEAAQAAVASSKGKVDTIAKTIGEAKSALSLKSLGTAFSKGFKTKAKQKFDEAFQSAKDKIDEINKGARSTDEIAKDSKDILDKGTERLGKFAEKVKSGESSVFEDAEEGVENPLRQTKSEFTDEDMGEENVANEQYDISNGLTDAETGVLEDNAAQIASGAGSGSVIDEAGLGLARVGAGESGIVDTLNAARTAGTDAIKVVTESISKQVAGTAVKEAVGESISAGLDAIPFLDVLGVIGGAVLTGVESHKEHKEEEAQGEATPMGASVSTQVGV